MALALVTGDCRVSGGQLVTNIVQGLWTCKALLCRQLVSPSDFVRS